ncbi:hypothetical protein N665_0053s0020 [Sinapis alba]|nr:hypothetical protein N665_0053s0020 [Sinapis alba]
MGEGIFGLKLTVERKLGVMDLKMSDSEKNQRLLRRRAKKIEKRLIYIESKRNEEKNYGEDMDFGQWNNFDYGRAEGKDKQNVEVCKENSESAESGKENSENGEKDKGNEYQVAVEKGTESREEEKENETDKTEMGTREEDEVSEEEPGKSERRRVEADAAWRIILSESDNDEEDEVSEEEKEEKAEGKDDQEKTERKEELLHHDASEKVVEEEAEKVVEEEAEKVVEEEKEDEEVVEKQSDKYTDEEKQMWVMVVYKGSEEMRDGTSEEMRDVTNEEMRDGINEVKIGIKLRYKQKIMMYGKPRKFTAKKKVTMASDGTPKKRGRPKKAETNGAAKKRGRPRKESATLVSCTPREKRKPQWLQIPFREGKTEDIDGPTKTRKTKA